ncbi:MAG: hypothetical protein QNJ74_02610 [Trichodesmium sp. MO_231.B1]|nr:hypothetical protein [Trichodesmium sp. MO_231.B1]
MAEIVEQCVFKTIDADWDNFKERKRLRELLFDANPERLFDLGGTAIFLRVALKES